jgi:glycosyltransferase involved in cell wall biosynthesis
MNEILFIYECRDDYLGGIQGKILMLARCLKARGNLSPALLTTRADSRFAQAFAAMGATVVSSPMRGISGIRGAVEAAERHVELGRCRIIQSHMFRESIVGRCLKRKHPSLQHVFRVHTHLDGRIPDLPRRVSFRILDRMTQQYVDRFVPISDIVADELHDKSGVSREKIEVVRNGVDAPCDADHSSGGDEPLPATAAIIGDLMERKQQVTAVRAIGALHARGLDVRLNIIGDDRENMQPAMTRLARELSIEHLLKFHGYLNTEHLGEVLRDVSIVLLPSLFEGTPTSIIEGMAMRKVVVTTPVGGTPEFVQDGVNGFLHPPRDDVALAVILERVLSSPSSNWNVLRDNAYSTWQANFSRDGMIEGLQAVYRDLGVI